jgi:meso-butanediol dehydrogenase / (S,S)-butanediol dehydrogenase / diacetyl reductase
MRFRGKQVIVTGGASGIGKASAEKFASEGANLVLADLNFQGAQEVAATLVRDYGIRANAIEFDAADSASCRRMIDQSLAALGTINVLCNIAGIMDWDNLENFSEDRWERVLRVNLSGVFYISRYAMPHLVKSRGNIVNMASAAALVGIPYTAAYCASKAGVVAVTKSLAIEFAEAGVRVNAICPTGGKTPMHAQNKFPEGVDLKLLMRNSPKMYGGELCEPEDIAAAVLFVASDEARYISGIALPVDGAQTAG